VLTFIDVSAVKAGIDPEFAFYLVAIVNAAGTFGRVSAGYLDDNFGKYSLKTRYSSTEPATPRCDEHDRTFRRGMRCHDVHLAFPRLKSRIRRCLHHLRVNFTPSSHTFGILLITHD